MSGYNAFRGFVSKRVITPCVVSKSSTNCRQTLLFLSVNKMVKDPVDSIKSYSMILFNNEHQTFFLKPLHVFIFTLNPLSSN